MEKKQQAGKRPSLRDNPKCPCGDFPWMGYYWKRKISKIKFEENYWGKVVDPDGISRNLSEERDQKIKDQKSIITFVNDLPPGSILDIGCGPGFTLSVINGKWEKYGLDISKYASNIAKKYCRVFTGLLADANYQSNFFDVVLLNQVLEFVDDPLLYVNEAKRVLKAGGYMIVASINFDSGCARLFGSNYRILKNPGYQNLFTDLSMMKLLEDINLKIEKIEYPFFQTRWFTKENLLRLFDKNKTSPPFYGNVFEIYAFKLLE